MDLTDMQNSLPLSAIGRRSEQREGSNIYIREDIYAGPLEKWTD